MQDQDPRGNEDLGGDFWEGILEFLDYGIHVGEGDKSIDLTLGLLLSLVVAIFLAKFLLRGLRKIMTRKMPEDDRLKFVSIFRYIKYLVYVGVVLVTINAAGIDITILITASAALFVGIGLALQELIQDIIAGVLILVDKSLLVGDIVELDGKVGKIFEIKLRTTRALTRDDKVLVIPNHKFIADVIFNYTQNHRTTRETVRVGVAYGSDVQLVTRLLLQAADEQPSVQKNPVPFVLFDDFGDSALLFSLNFFIRDAFTDPRVKSDIRYRIDSLFREHQVTIPFPQRDVHFYQKFPMQVRSLPLEKGSSEA